MSKSPEQGAELPPSVREEGVAAKPKTGWFTHFALAMSLLAGVYAFFDVFIPLADQPDPPLFGLFIVGLMIMWFILTPLGHWRDGR